MICPKCEQEFERETGFYVQRNGSVEIWCADCEERRCAKAQKRNLKARARESKVPAGPHPKARRLVVLPPWKKRQEPKKPKKVRRGF